MKYRIKRCKGNRSAWAMLTLREDGTELDVAFSYVTGFSLDALLSRGERELGLKPGDKIELVYEDAFVEATT